MAPAIDKALVVVGAGPLGLISTLALAERGHPVCLIGPKAPEDSRTTAILQTGVDLLEEIGVWDKLSHKVAPLKIIRLIDGSKRLIRTPQVQFNAVELGQDAFGYNVKNNDLLAALQTKINDQKNINWLQQPVISCDIDADNKALLTLDNETSCRAELVIAADGRNSFIREAVGIQTRSWSYPQTALVLNLSHTRNHDNISTEFHTETGPFTFVPLPGQKSSLVWVEKPDKARDLCLQSREQLGRIISEKSCYFLGDISVDTDPVTYPLSGLTAQVFGKGPIALIGESAHVFPPIGAQGMNLGLRDIRSLLDTLHKNPKSGYPTAPSIVTHYAKARRIDIHLRTGAVDLLNRSLLTNMLPVHLSRGLGFYALEKFSGIRKFVIRMGLG